MAHSPADLNAEAFEFLTVRHLATLSTLRRDGTPHAVPIGFTFDGSLARVITRGGSQKARNAARGDRVAICQVEGGRWLTLEGTSRVSDEPARVADAEQRYAQRYRQPRENPARVVLEIEVDRVLGSVAFFGEPS